MSNKSLRNLLVSSVAGVLLCAPLAYAQPQSDPEFDEILSLDIADLTVTSVSKRPQRLNSTASAIYVITQEDIRRMGADNIPDALRVVPGIQVAQVASNKWAISARGFNSTLSNKMLVMIDGRSVYSPVFSGTYWDDRMVPMQEIERIEVIRGPGASVWGANALQGIIHIITKNGKDSPESYATTSLGTLSSQGGGAKAGKLADGSYYRAYADYMKTDASSGVRGNENIDDWDRMRAGFRLDGENANGNKYNINASAYGGGQESRQTVRLRTAPYSSTYNSDDNSYGGNIGGSWDHAFSTTSNGTFKAYLDHYTRLEELTDHHITTLDLDWQHDIQTSDRNNFSWGAGYRRTMSELAGSFTARVSEEQRNYNLFSAFLQNEYALLENELFLTVGSKFEQNEFTGFEVQPNARLSWVLDNKQTLWGSVSRAVRSPSIVEDDINLVTFTGPGPTYNVTFGTADVKSEDLIAYEVGYRVELTPKLQLDNTAYYNNYDNLITYEAGTPYLSGTTFINPLNAANMGRGHVYGVESAATYTVSPTLKLLGSYSYSEMDLKTDVNSTYSLNNQEELLPQHTFSLRSYWNVTPTVNFDNMGYFVDGLSRSVDSYIRYDTRLGWQATPQLELSLTGHNLLDDRHREFNTTPSMEVERSFIARATYKF